jgi:hypothetical protein
LPGAVRGKWRRSRDRDPTVGTRFGLHGAKAVKAAMTIGSPASDGMSRNHRHTIKTLQETPPNPPRNPHVAVSPHMEAATMADERGSRKARILEKLCKKV